MRQPRKVSARLLENVALHYLARFAASTELLRRVLLRRVERSDRTHGTDRGEGVAVVDALIARLAAAGLVDDRSFAAARAAGLHRRGASRRAIAAHLRNKGIAAELIAAALDTLAADGDDVWYGASRARADIDWAAAVNLARRRRLGPFRSAAERAAHRDKDLATLARAGFTYAIATRLLAAEAPEDLERPEDA